MTPGNGKPAAVQKFLVVACFKPLRLSCVLLQAMEFLDRLDSGESILLRDVTSTSTVRRLCLPIGHGLHTWWRTSCRKHSQRCNNATMKIHQWYKDPRTGLLNDSESERRLGMYPTRGSVPADVHPFQCPPRWTTEHDQPVVRIRKALHV